MKVHIVEPYGFCQGVIRAIAMAEKTKRDHPDERVSVLGMLVHNQVVLQHLKELGVETIEIAPDDYSQGLARIKDGYVIFTAHGHDPQLETLAQKQGLQIVDATCPYVLANFQALKQTLAQKRDAVFIGLSHHPETVAALAQDSRIIFYDINQGWMPSRPAMLTRPVLFNQTTLSMLDLGDIHQQIQRDFPDAFENDEICSATRKRQHALLSLSHPQSTILIIGDHRSNNTEQLRRLAIKHYPEAQVFKINSLSDLQAIEKDLSSEVSLVSGASTPQETTDAIALYLMNRSN